MMIRTTVCFAILAVLCVVLGTVPHTAAAQTPAAASVSYADGRTDEPALLTLRLPVATIAEQTATVAGLTDYLETPGAPRLPIYARLIPVPMGQTVTAELRESDVSTAVVGFLQPAPTVIVTDPEALRGAPLESAERVYTADPAVYDRDAFYPDAAYTISQPFAYGGAQYVRVTLHPLRYNPATQELRQSGALQLILNFQETAERDPQAPDARPICCNLPANPRSERTKLPVGSTAYRIVVNQDGIYQVTYSDLQAAGMPVDAIDPRQFVMLYNGSPMAFELVGDGDGVFEPGEAVRFFGQKFEGPRTEKQYINDNVYWLWVDPVQTPLWVATAPNPAGYTPVDRFYASITAEEDLFYNATYTNRWPFFPNEPDAWLWAPLRKESIEPTKTFTFTVSLPNPVPTADPATLTTEIFGQGDQQHIIRTTYNGYGDAGQISFIGYESRNVVMSVPADRLINGVNTINVINASPGLSQARLNRITFDYWRQLTAVNNQLLFSHNGTGQYEFNVGGFTGASAIVWNVTDPLAPQRVGLQAADIVDNSGVFNYRIAGAQTGVGRYIAVSAAAVKSPLSVSAYNVVELDPPAGAEWVAISHSLFMPATQRLAAHRSQPLFGGLSTHIVDVDDVIAQYGYGMPNPSGIRDFLGHAVTNWPVKPRYALLMGDGTNNPRGLNCLPPLCSTWSIDPNYVPTFLLFIDRFQGQISSDYPYQLLTGGDEEPDIAVGRVAASSLQNAHNVVDKTIRYETNELTPQEYMRNILFISDDTDSGGNFCAASHAVGDDLDPSFNTIYKCLPDGTAASLSAMRTEILNVVNNTGVSLINYRGHGTITGWASGLLNRSHAPLWTNADRPVIIITADCLDGYFAWTGTEAISETYHEMGNGGSAAHWSSSGLGFLFEYTVMHHGFYDGLFLAGLTAIGDAVSFAKLAYVNTSPQYDPSVLYAMTLQSDPALLVLRPDLEFDVSAAATTVRAGDTLAFQATVTNHGLYATRSTVTIMLPPQLTLFSAAASLPGFSYTVVGDQVIIQIDELLGYGESITIDLALEALVGAPSPVPVNFGLESPGLPIANRSMEKTFEITITSQATAVGLRGQPSASAWSLWPTLILSGAMLLVWLTRRLTPIRRA